MLKSYLGNGVYAEFAERRIKLSVERKDGTPTNIIYIDGDTMVTLREYAERHRESLYKPVGEVYPKGLAND